MELSAGPFGAYKLIIIRRPRVNDAILDSKSQGLNNSSELRIYTKISDATKRQFPVSAETNTYFGPSSFVLPKLFECYHAAQFNDLKPKTRTRNVSLRRIQLRTQLQKYPLIGNLNASKLKFCCLAVACEYLKKASMASKHVYLQVASLWE